MGKTRHTASSLDLQRKQLDTRLANLPSLEPPRGGWIRTIRQSLGMTMQQLGNRLNISPQSVRDIELREQSESISVAKLREAAEALNCELRFVLIPRPSLGLTIRNQAVLKAREERNRLTHTMRLEAQSEGVEQVLDLDRAVDQWISDRATRLWD